MKFTESRSPMKSVAFTEARLQYRYLIWQRLQLLWQFLLNICKTEEVELRVWSSRDRTGATWWSAKNVRTGRSIFNVSEEQIRRWLEKQC